MEMLMGTGHPHRLRESQLRIYEPRRAHLPRRRHDRPPAPPGPYCFAMEILLTADAVPRLARLRHGDREPRGRRTRS